MNVRAINHLTILKKSDTKYCSLLKTTIKDKHFHELVTSVREKKYSWCEIQLQTSGCICLHKHHQWYLMMYEGLIVLSHFIRGDLNHYPLQLFSEGQGGNRKPGVGIQIGNGIKWEESTAMLAAHWAWMIRPVVLWAKCKRQHANMLKMTRKSHFEKLGDKKPRGWNLDIRDESLFCEEGKHLYDLFMTKMETEESKIFMCWIFNIKVNAINHSTVLKSDTKWRILHATKNYDQTETL